MALDLADILAARRRIAGTVAQTPLVPSRSISSLTEREFLLKLEMTQPVGSFKLRGAANAVFALPPDATGVTCCSTGNHGRAIAHAAKVRAMKAAICMSSLVPEAKLAGIRALGGEVRIVGGSQDEAQAESRRLAAEEGFVEISPFDDPLVIAGQGTIGLELLAERPDLAAILVPVSGGGLAGGVALAAKAIHPDIRVIGISMDRGAAMHASIRAGRPVETREVASLADSLGGGIGLDNRHSFRLCRDLVDEIVLVSEDEIYRAMQTLYYEERMVAEGAAVVAIAALQAGRIRLPPGPAAAILTGRNVDMEQFTHIVTGRNVRLGDMTVEGTPYVQ